jgi:uncharacterized protein (TIGR02246 family)
VQESDDQRAIRNLVADWMAAHRSGDTQAVLDLTDDAVFMLAGRPLMTKADFPAACSAFVESKLTFEGTSDIKEICVEGTMAYSLSDLTITTGSGAGPAIDRRSFHTLTVYRKVDGRWRLARDANLLVAA